MEVKTSSRREPVTAQLLPIPQALRPKSRRSEFRQTTRVLPSWTATPMAKGICICYKENNYDSKHLSKKMENQTYFSKGIKHTKFILRNC